MSFSRSRRLTAIAAVLVIIISALFLTENNIPVLERAPGSYASKTDVVYAGYVGRYGDWIYYIDYQTGMGGKLHKFSTDGSRDIKITDDMVSDARIMNGFIFYVSDYKSGNKLYRINTDGSGKILLMDPGITPDRNFDGTSIAYMDAAEGKVLYSYLDNSRGTAGRSQLFKINEDGSEKQKIADDVLNFHVYNWNIYYKSSRDNTVYSMGLHGENKKQLSNQRTCSIGQSDYNVYYKNYDNPGIVKINTGGDNINIKQILYDNNVESIINVVNGWVYYIRKGDGIYKARTRVGPFGNKPVFVKSFR